MPKAQGPDFGASERFSVSPGDEANGLMQMPTGQSGHPLSDFYRQGHDDWVHGRPSPYLPGETLYTLTLTPAS
jgi:penicillin amidase